MKKKRDPYAGLFSNSETKISDTTDKLYHEYIRSGKKKHKSLFG